MVYSMASIVATAPLERVQRARTALVLDHPFFGVLALRLRLIEDASIPTMATDGTVILFSPAFVAKCSDKELQGVLAHEVMHCGCGHPWRRDGREQVQWNIACDYAINHVVIESGLTLPKGHLRDKKYDGKWSEWIYDRLPELKKITIGFGAGGDDVKDPGSAPQGDGVAVDATMTEADWAHAVKQVAAAEKTRGTLPASIERLVGLAGQTRVDWRSMLRRFVQEAARSDYQWTRPNVRHLSQGLYMPGLRAEAMGPIAVAIDTSGSIDRVMLTQFSTELNAITDDVQPERVHVAYCDAQIQRVDTFERGDPIALKPKGGGGTAFEPVMEWADGLDEPPVCLVYLTDLYGSFGTAPNMPVLWATSTPHAQVPYGEVVHIQ